MASLNRMTIMGNLGGAPEMRYDQDGKPFTKIDVAVNTQTANGLITEWFKVIIFGIDAENCNKYLGRGDAVYVEGRLQTRTYLKDDETKKVIEIICNKILFLNKLLKQEVIETEEIA